MTPHDLLANFEVLAEAPKGIQRLRELVLELAVRGKLVEQNPLDELAEDLLKRIKAEKSRLVKEGQARAGKALPVTNPTDFDVPRGWASIRFGECIELVSGQHLSPGEFHLEQKGLPYLTGPADFGLHSPIPSRWTFETRAVAKEGDILVTVKGAGIGKANILDVARAAISRQLMAVRPILIDRDYTYLCIRASFRAFQEKQVGIAIPGIGREDVLHHQVLLPPIAEQRRIVVRADELMALLDRLEAKRQDRETARAAARDSALAALREAPTPEDVETAWLRIQERFHELFATPEDVGLLRQTILDLAVEGKLIEGIEWIVSDRGTLGDYVDFQNGYAFKSEWYIQNGTPLVRNINVGHGFVDWKDRACISIEQSLEFERFSLDEGDIVITLDRPIISTGVKIARIQASDLPCLLLQRVARPLIQNKNLSSDFLFMWFTSPAFVRAIDPGRSNGVPHISTKQIKAMPYRLMSITSQKATLERANDLLQQCNRLGRLLGAQLDIAGQFAAAAVHHLDA